MWEENKTVWHPIRVYRCVCVSLSFRIIAFKVLKRRCHGSSWSDNVMFLCYRFVVFSWLCGLFSLFNPVLLCFFCAVSCFLLLSYFEGPLYMCLLWLNTSLGGSFFFFFCTWSLLTCLPGVFEPMCSTSLRLLLWVSLFFDPSVSFGLFAYSLKVRVFVWQWISSVCLVASSASGTQKPCSACFPAQTWPKRGLFKLSRAKSRLHKRTALRL